MEHGINAHSCILFILFAMLQTPSVYGRVAPWCSVIDYALVGRTYMTIDAIENQKLCYQACLNDSPRCKSANYRPTKKECDLNCVSQSNVCAGGRLVEQPGSTYIFTASKMGCSTQHDSTRATSCDMKSASQCDNRQGSDWHLVLKGVAGTGIKLYDLWTKAIWDCGSEEHENYRNETLYNAWKNRQLNITQVKLSLYDHTGDKVELVFKGENSDIQSWFAQEHLVSSPWSDLTTSTTTNFFSITGFENSEYERRFYINENHGGCGVDRGWLAVIDISGACPWEQSHCSYPVILYSAENAVSWNDARNDGTLGIAEYLTIHIETE